MSATFLDQYEPGALRLGTGRRHEVVARALRLELLDDDGAPLVGEPYEVGEGEAILADGRLDADGRAEVLVVCKGEYHVRFPELCDDVWRRAGDSEEAPLGPLEAQSYRVQRAETLQMLLYRERGIIDPEPTFNAPENKLLANTRTPALLLAGDRVHLPQPRPRGVKRLPLEPGELAEFRVRGQTRKLRLTLRDKGQALAGAAYTVEVDGLTLEGTTDGEGALEESIPLGATEARLLVGGRARTLVLGGLDPLHTVTGVQARLNNLGFYVGAVDGVIGPLTRRGIRKFQRSQSLIVDGHVGPKTREALRRAYGE
jgi:hypothetical protein